MHGPIPSLRSCAAGGDGRFHSNAAISPRVVAIHKFDLAGVDVRGLQLRQGFFEKLETIAARKVRVLDQGQRSIRLASHAAVVRRRSCPRQTGDAEYDAQQQPDE